MNRTLLPTLTLAAVVGLTAAPAAQALSLEDCIRAALTDSPDPAAAAARVEAARAAYQQAGAAYHPLISASGGYTRTDNAPQAFMMALNQRSLNMADPAFNPNQPDDTGNTRLSLGAKYRLYDGGRRAADVALARGGLAAAEAGRDAVVNILIHEVTRSFHGLLQAKAMVAVQEEALKALEESLRVANERLNAGAAVKADVLNLEVRVAQTREDLLRARHGVDLAVVALNTAIGRELVQADAVTAPADEHLPDLPAVGDEAIEQRAELHAAETMARLGEMAVRRAVREYAPTLSAFGSVDWDSDRFNDFEQSYLAGVVAEWDLFDGHRRLNGVRAARASLAEARAGVRKARNQLTLDLKQAQLQAREARERFDVTARCLGNAEEALRLTQLRYQQGAGELSELLTAQAGLASVRSRRAAAYYDYLTAVSNVKRAAGMLAGEFTK